MFFICCDCFCNFCIFIFKIFGYVVDKKSFIFVIKRFENFVFEYEVGYICIIGK